LQRGGGFDLCYSQVIRLSKIPGHEGETNEFSINLDLSDIEPAVELVSMPQCS
jgi:hypothetical protein